MELRQIKFKQRYWLLIVTGLCCFALYACGGGKKPPEDSASETGALSFNMIFHNDSGTNHKFENASIDCASLNIATVVAKVYNSGNTFIAGGGPWDCEAGQGTITSVPVGSGMTVAIWAKDVDENILFYGQQTDILVIAGSENNIGTINCDAFIPNLLAPANAEEVLAGDVVLLWQDVAGATEYRVLVSQNSDMSNHDMQDQTAAVNYTLSGFSSNTTYYWQVFAVDSDGNSGIGSQILSFTIQANTLPIAHISIPAKGSTYIIGENGGFKGSGSDTEDGALNGESLVWTSDVAGRIGIGESCSWSPLNSHAGTHKITLTAIDSENATGLDSVVITIASGRLPDTGQITSYTSTFGEDADFTINPPSYTKLDSAGNEIDDNATVFAMVRDNVTGLIWEVKTTEEDSIHYMYGEFAWRDIQEQFIDNLNDADFGEHSNWRLPTIKELATIVHRGKYDPAVNTVYFPNAWPTVYWSATTCAGSSDRAWLMHFGTGVVDLDQKSSSYYVRAVCNGPSTGHLVDNGDNTVTDTATGLMWQQLEVVDELNAVSPMTWEEALSYCETLELAGYDDWRLPNINELQSITDYEKAVSANDPAIDTGFFPNAVPDIYWSATTYIDHTEGAWTVSFGSGIVSIYTKSIGHYVRVVRGGQ